MPYFYLFLHDVKQWWKGNNIFMVLWEASIFCATQFAGNTKPWSIKLEIESVHWLFLFGTSKRRRFQIGRRIRFPQDTLEKNLTGLFAVESCDASYGFVGRINQFLIKPPITLKKYLVLLKTFAQKNYTWPFKMFSSDQTVLHIMTESVKNRSIIYHFIG